MKTLPKGCDYQGRYPEAAECCTELGAEQDDGTSPLSLNWLIVAVFAIGLLALVVNLLLVTFA